MSRFSNGRIKNLTFVLLSPDISCFCKQCRSRSDGFWRSQLTWICTVCHLVSFIWIKESDLLRIITGRDILIYSAWHGLRYTSYFSTKIYVVGIHWKPLIEVLLMSTHNISLCGKIWKIFIWIRSLILINRVVVFGQVNQLGSCQAGQFT